MQVDEWLDHTRDIEPSHSVIKYASVITITSDNSNSNSNNNNNDNEIFIRCLTCVLLTIPLTDLNLHIHILHTPLFPDEPGLASCPLKHCHCCSASKTRQHKCLPAPWLWACHTVSNPAALTTGSLEDVLQVVHNHAHRQMSDVPEENSTQCLWLSAAQHHVLDYARQCQPTTSWKHMKFGKRAFSYTGPVVWNSLPVHVQEEMDFYRVKKTTQDSHF